METTARHIPAITLAHKLGRIRRAKRSAQTGAVLVEFAIVSIFLLVMLFGIIQYGIIISSLSQCQQVTREGLRFYTVHYADPNDSNDTITYMQSVASGTFLTNADISTSSVTIAPLNTTLTGIGNPYQLTFTYNMGKRTFFGGFVPGVNKGTNTITKTAVAVVEQ